MFIDEVKAAKAAAQCAKMGKLHLHVFLYLRKFHLFLKEIGGKDKVMQIERPTDNG